jgi:acetyltransferase-like isoleucine patch superfamily enzyme
MSALRAAIEVLAERGPVTFAAVVSASLSDELKRRRVNLRRDVTIHPSAEVNRNAVFGRDGRIVVRSDCRIRHEALLYPSGGWIELGSGSLVNAFSTIFGQGGVEVGDGVLVGPQSTIVAANHVYSDRDVPVDEQGLSTEGVEIRDDVWIGSNCTILDGVTVGEGAVVAAGSVVTESVPEYAVVAGVPAERIGSR